MHFSSNVNINVAAQLLFDRINNAVKLCCQIFEQRPHLQKIQLKHGFQVKFVQIYNRKGKTIIHLLDKIKSPINSTHDLEILSQIKLGKQK